MVMLVTIIGITSQSLIGNVILYTDKLYRMDFEKSQSLIGNVIHTIRTNTRLSIQ